MTDVFEEKKLSKAVIKLGVPAVLGQLATLIYNLADTYFVALTRVPAMIAAVTLSTPILLIIMSIAAIFGMGGNSVIARLIGGDRRKEAADCFEFCTFAMAASGLIIMALGLVFMKKIALTAGADSQDMQYTCDYLRWIFIGAPAIVLSNGLVHTFRSAGLIKEATTGLFIGNGANIVLDWLFIVMLKMGTSGAALATSLGFVFSTVYYIVCIIRQKRRGNDLVPVSGRLIPQNRKLMSDVIRIGIPGALITVLLSVSNIILNNYISMYGSGAVASYGIAYKIDLFPILISVGFAQGIAPLLGYYFGRQDKDRLSGVMRTGIIYDVIIGAVFTAVILAMRRSLAGVFLVDDALITQTAWFLTLTCWHAPVIGVINMVTAYFQALGKAVNSLVVTLMRNAVLFIPGVIIMNRLLGLNGVILTQLMVEAVLAIVCLLMYAAASPEKLLCEELPYSSSGSEKHEKQLHNDLAGYSCE